MYSVNEPNGFGLYDMSEGVHEWYSDFYDPNYYHYSPERNPQGSFLRAAACISLRLLAPSHHIQPLRRQKLSASGFQIRRLWISRSNESLMLT